MRSLRGGKGLGDALYVQSVARHLVSKGERLIVRSDYPDVFRPLSASVEVQPFTREGIEIVAHYANRRYIRNCTQFEDCCVTAGVPQDIPLKLDWRETSGIAHGLPKPYICVQLPRTPCNKPRLADDLLPDCSVIQRMIDRLKGRFTVVQIGAGKPLYRFTSIDVDLAGRTTVAEMIDAAASASGFLGYCSFMVPLAESLDKPALFVWSRKGLNRKFHWVATARPEKILHKWSSRWVVDSDPQEKRDEAADAFLR